MSIPRIYRSDSGEYIATDDAGRKVRAPTHEEAERIYMADQLKIDAVTELSDLTARANTVFDEINMWMVRNARFGLVPAAPDKTPDEPLTDSDFTGAIEGMSAPQFYGVVAFFAGLSATIDPATARLLARFGKRMSV